MEGKNARVDERAAADEEFYAANVRTFEAGRRKLEQKAKLYEAVSKCTLTARAWCAPQPFDGALNAGCTKEGEAVPLAEAWPPAVARGFILGRHREIQKSSWTYYVERFSVAVVHIFHV